MAHLASQRVETESACQRGLGRAEVALESVIEVPRGHYPCSVYDLSLDGARIKTDEPVSPDQNVWLRLNKLRVFCTVQWVRPGSIGVQFEEKLPKAFVLDILGEDISPEAYKEAETLLKARDWVIGAVPLKTGAVSAADMLNARNTKSGDSGYLRDGLWSYLLTPDGSPLAEDPTHKKAVIALFAVAAILGCAMGWASLVLF